MVKHIVFDFDGTLVDSKDVFVSVFNRLADKNKCKTMTPDDIDILRKLSIVERCKYLNFSVYKLPFLASQMRQLYKQYLKNLTMFEGVKELLDDLKSKGYHLAIISSNAENNIRQVLHENHIDYIGNIFSASNIFGKDKVISKYLKTYRLKSSEVIYIGDEQRDIVACKKNGIKIIWVSWGYDLKEIARQEGPDYMVDKPREIIDIIQTEFAKSNPN